MNGSLLLLTLALAADPKPIPDGGSEILRRAADRLSTRDQVAWDPTGQRIVGVRTSLDPNVTALSSGGPGGPHLAEIWEYDLTTGKASASVKFKPNTYWKPVVSPSGGLIAAVVPAAKKNQPLSLRVLTGRGTEAYRIEAYPGGSTLSPVVFSPTDKYLVTHAVGDTSMILWDGKRGTQVRKVERANPGFGKPVLYAGFSGDEKRLVVFDPIASKLEVYDTGTGKELVSHDLSKVIAWPKPLDQWSGTVTGYPVVSADGRYAVLPTERAKADRENVQLVNSTWHHEVAIDLTTGKEVVVATGRSDVLHLSADGKTATAFYAPPMPLNSGPGLGLGFEGFGNWFLAMIGWPALVLWPVLPAFPAVALFERIGFLPPILSSTGWDPALIGLLMRQTVSSMDKLPPRQGPFASFTIKDLTTGNEVVKELKVGFEFAFRTPVRRFITGGLSLFDLETHTESAIPKAGQRREFVGLYGGSWASPSPDGRLIVVEGEVPADPPKPGANPRNKGGDPVVMRQLPPSGTKFLLFPLIPAKKK